MRVIKTTTSVATKFCAMIIKTIKCSSWESKHVCNKAAILRTIKLPYFSNSLTDHHEIWHGDTHGHSELYCASQGIMLFYLIKLQNL